MLGCFFVSQVSLISWIIKYHIYMYLSWMLVPKRSDSDTVIRTCSSIFGKCLHLVMIYSLNNLTYMQPFVSSVSFTQLRLICVRFSVADAVFTHHLLQQQSIPREIKNYNCSRDLLGTLGFCSSLMLLHNSLIKYGSLTN